MVKEEIIDKTCYIDFGIYEEKQVGLFEGYSYLISSIVSLYQKTKQVKYLNLAKINKTNRIDFLR